MDWCEKNGVEYVSGLSKNAVLAAQIFASTDEVCVKRAIGNLDVVRDRFHRAKIDREGFDERCRVPYPGDPCRPEQSDERLILCDRHLNIQKRRILLRAENVRVPRAAARPQASNRELDGVGRVEFDEIGESGFRDPIQRQHRLPAQRPASAHRLVGAAIAEYDVEGDTIYPGILAPDGLGEFVKFSRLHQTPASVM
jgi:hypothetical protein